MAKLRRRAVELTKEALAPATHKAYNRGLQQYKNFCICHSINFKIPIVVTHLLCFLTFLFDNGYAPPAIISINSALSYFHKSKGTFDSTQVFAVKQLLKGFKKKRPSTDSRKPISFTTLKKLCNSLPNMIMESYSTHLLKAMFLLAFHFALRIGEITVSPHNLKMSNIKIKKMKLTIDFSSYKHCPSFFQKHTIKAKAFDPCPVTALEVYLKLRGLHSGPLFLYNGKPISRKFFVGYLKQCFTIIGLDNKHFNSHSFRIGVASYWLASGYTDIQIKQMGRWRSDAVLKYLRGSINHNK